MPKDNLINESRASSFGYYVRQGTSTRLASSRMTNKSNDILKSEEYLNLTEIEKQKWWKKEFPDTKKLIDDYNKKIEEELKLKYIEKKEQKVKTTNRLAKLSNEAAAYGGPLTSAKIAEEDFFGVLLKEEKDKVVKVLNLECSILRILHPTDSILFRTKKLNKITRKQESIPPSEIIHKLKEYFLSMPITEASAGADLVAYFEDSTDMEN